MTLNIKNNISDLSLLAPFIEQLADTYGIAPDQAFKINLALDEAMANVVSYAYPEGTEGAISLTAEKEDGILVFQITDEGAPFDPTKEGDVDTTLSVEERPVGGLGIFLIKQMMDTVTYQRVGNKNVLTLTMGGALPPTHHLRS